MRIAKAVKENRWNRVKALQHLLTRSFYAKLLAVKRVTSNKGKKTPGIDGVLWIAGFLDAVVAGLTTALGREWTFGALQISLGNIVSFVVGILIAIKVSQLIRFVLDEDVLSRLDLAKANALGRLEAPHHRHHQVH